MTPLPPKEIRTDHQVFQSDLTASLQPGLEPGHGKCVLHVCSRAALGAPLARVGCTELTVSGPVLGACLDSAQTKIFKAAQKQRGEKGNSIEELQKPCSFVKVQLRKKKKFSWKSIYQNEPLRFLPYPLPLE